MQSRARAENPTQDDGDFERLDDDDVPGPGPAAVLLCAFEEHETAAVATLLEQIGAGEHQVVHCSTTMGQWPLERALSGGDEGQLLPAGQAPRIMVLSGLSGGQVNGLLDRYRATELPGPVFAMATESNLEWSIIDLMGNLMAEAAGGPKG